MQPAAAFTPLALAFKSGKPEALYTDWEAKVSRDGVEVTVTARVFPAGFIDLKTSFRNVSARQIYGAYAALVRER